MKSLVINYNSELSGCDYYRAILPARHIRSHFAEKGIEVREEIRDWMVGTDKMDALMVHRTYPDAFTRHILARKAMGCKLIWDADDLLINLPPWNPLAASWNLADTERWHALSGHANVAITSTYELSRHVNNPITFVCPNLLDANDWHGTLPHPEDTDRIRIVWAGSHTHREDLDIVVGPLRRIMDRHGDKVQVIMFGYLHPELIKTHLCQIIFFDAVNVGRYPGMLMSLRPHIGLGPLKRHPFNDCKSNCKWMELTAAGAVFVSSGDSGPYSLHTGSHPITEDDWEAAIEEMIHNHEMRSHVHSVARQELVSHWTWQNSPKKKTWYDAIEKAIGE